MEKKNNFKSLAVCIATLVFSFNMNAQGKGIGGDNGATKEHSAFVNKNGNNGKANEGNNGQGYGNNAFGNLGNENPNGRAGGSRSIPLDGGLGILLIGAAAFGIKKLRDK